MEIDSLEIRKVDKDTELAEKLHLSDKTVSKWESGVSHN